MNPFSLIWQALRLWWKHWIGLLILNIVWFLLLLPVVTAPAATAMFFELTRRTIRDETWDWRDLYGEVNDHLWSAWRWALPNLLVAAVLLGNFAAYSSFSGGLWFALRVVWGMLLLVWLMLNLVFWPFWLAQEDRTLRTTYTNCARFILRHGPSALALALLSLALLVVSVWLVVPFVLGLTGWVVLLNTLAVERSLAANARS